MGLIKATVFGSKKELADQWLEYYYCDTMASDILVQKAHKRVQGGSNTKATDNIITNGSGFAVNEGQALIIIEDGKIVEFTTEPGRFTWDESSEPSLFDNGTQGLKDSFKNLGKRITYGGDAAKDQRAYFINMKEIMDNKFGTASPMAYNDPTYRGIYIRYYGMYTFKVKDPIRFFTSVSGNVEETYSKESLREQCESEFITALDSTLAKCSDANYQYNDLVKHQKEIADLMNTELDEEWNQRRGMEIESVGLIKVLPDDESRARIQKIDDSIMLSDPKVAAGRLVDAQANAMEKAAENDAGALAGFMGLGMANQSGLGAGSIIESMNHSQEKSNEKETWVCICGNRNTGKFCGECGKPKAQEGFTCTNPQCGFHSDEIIKFCPECGQPSNK